MIRILLILIISFTMSCNNLNDYYSSKEYKIKKRQEESYKMFLTTHNVRKTCNTNNKHKRYRRKKAKYTN